MKTTIKGNYSFRKPSKGKGSKALAVVGLILIFFSLVAGTQYFAWTVGRNRLPNELFRYAGIRIYSPIEILEWLRQWKLSRRSGGLHGQPDIDGRLCIHGSCTNRDNSEE